MDRMRWQTIHECDSCGSELTRHITTKHRMFDNYASYSGCDCGLITMNPRPDPDYYTGLFMDGILGRKSYQMLQVEKSFIGLLRRLLEYPDKKERLYAIGCGLGTLVFDAIIIGMDAKGNDINIYNVDYAREELAIDIDLCPTHKLELESDYYDIITMKSYLGHSFYPYSEIKMSYNALRSGGILFYRDSYIRNIRSLHSNQIELDHISYFTHKALWDMFLACGFFIEEIKELKPLRDKLYQGKVDIIARKS